jgi:hypothetical protein
MKTFSLIIFSLILFVFRLNGQTPFDETATIVDLPNGIFFQQGPGINNTLNWKYPYSTKLTINGGIARNFELSSIGKENVSYVIRQFSQTKNSWTTWKKLILDDGNGNIGIGTESPSNKLDVEGKIDGTIAIEVSNTNSGNNARRGIIVGNGTSGHSAYLFSTSSNYNAIPSWKNSGVLGTDCKLSNGLVIRSSSGGIRFQPSGISDKIVFNSDGNVGIGTDLSSNPDNYKLAVNGTIGAKEIKVESSSWSDFVFDDGYELKSIEEVEQYIKKNGHLSEIPDQETVEKNGVNLGEMNAKLLQKIEELTLYLIKQNKELKSQKEQNLNQQSLIEQLQKEVSVLKNK